MSILKRAQEKTPTNVSNKLSPDLQLQFLPSEPRNPFKGKSISLRGIGKGLTKLKNLGSCTSETCKYNVAKKDKAKQEKKEAAAKAKQKKKEDDAKAKQKKKEDDAKAKQKKKEDAAKAKQKKKDAEAAAKKEKIRQRDQLIKMHEEKVKQERDLIDFIKEKFTEANPKLLEIIFKRHAQDTKAILKMFFDEKPCVPVKMKDALQDIIDLLNLAKKEDGINPTLKAAKALEKDQNVYADEKFHIVQEAIKEMKKNHGKKKKKLI